MNSNLAILASWAHKNCLNLNPTKSQCLLLGSRKLLSSVPHSSLPPIILSGAIIPISSQVKNLGVVISSDLSWDMHVSYVCRKTLGSLHSLRRLKNLLPPTLKKSHVQSLIFPLFDYCDVVCLDLTVAQANRLQKVQNTCARFVLEVKSMRDHMTPHLNSLGWLNLERRRQLHQATSSSQSNVVTDVW